MKIRTVSFFIITTLLVIALIILRLCWGNVSFSLSDLFAILSGSAKLDKTAYIILVHLRFPVIIATVLGGAALSVSGLQMQALFQNALADPFILGISSASALSTLVFLLLSTHFEAIALLGSYGNIISSAIFTTVVLSCILLFDYKTRRPESLLLIGVMIGFAITSVTSILIYLAPPMQRNDYLLWVFGSFSRITLNEVPYFASFITIGLLLSLLLSYVLNLFLLGKDYAVSSGVSFAKIQILILINTFLLTGVTTAFCGPIGFVGLAVPHMARKLLATWNHKLLVPACMLFGAFVMLLSDMIASLPYLRISLPVSSVTALLGAPLMIFLLWNNHRVKL